nr:hypothetical protein [Limosilactobacillus equigenerosi]
MRDRYGLDIKVRIKGFTKYLDNSDPTNEGSITFGNTSKALRDINTYLVDDLKTLKQSAREVNNWISNRMRISSSSKEWLEQIKGNQNEGGSNDPNK